MNVLWMYYECMVDRKIGGKTRKWITPVVVWSEPVQHVLYMHSVVLSSLDYQVLNWVDPTSFMKPM